MRLLDPVAPCPRLRAGSADLGQARLARGGVNAGGTAGQTAGMPGGGTGGFRQQLAAEHQSRTASECSGAGPPEGLADRGVPRPRPDCPERESRPRTGADREPAAYGGPTDPDADRLPAGSP